MARTSTSPSAIGAAVAARAVAYHATFEEVHAALDGMRERYAVGAITNGNADVHHIGIGHYFDFVITAADAGAAKPKAEIFQAALAAAGVEACHAVHVGDDPKRDVHGANAVGMRTVWVNVNATPWPGGPPARHRRGIRGENDEQGVGAGS